MLLLHLNNNPLLQIQFNLQTEIAIDRTKAPAFISLTWNKGVFWSQAVEQHFYGIWHKKIYEDQSNSVLKEPYITDYHVVTVQTIKHIPAVFRICKHVLFLTRLLFLTASYSITAPVPDFTLGRLMCSTLVHICMLPRNLFTAILEVFCSITLSSCKLHMANPY